MLSNTTVAAAAAALLAGAGALTPPGGAMAAAAAGGGGSGPVAGQSLPVGVPIPGVVKIWYEEKGYGFLVPDAGGNDVFVHRSALSDGQTLQPGMKVSFEVQWNAIKGKYGATKCFGALPGGIGMATGAVALGGAAGGALAGGGGGLQGFVPGVGRCAEPSCNLFIAGLPAGSNEEVVAQIFAAYGGVAQVKVLPDSGRGDRAALVRMDNILQAQWIVENLNQNIPIGLSGISSTPLTVRFADNRAERAKALGLPREPLGGKGSKGGSGAYGPASGYDGPASMGGGVAAPPIERGRYSPYETTVAVPAAPVAAAVQAGTEAATAATGAAAATGDSGLSAAWAQQQKDPGAEAAALAATMQDPAAVPPPPPLRTESSALTAAMLQLGAVGAANGATGPGTDAGFDTASILNAFAAPPSLPTAGSVPTSPLAAGSAVATPGTGVGGLPPSPRLDLGSLADFPGANMMDMSVLANTRVSALTGPLFERPQQVLA